MAARLVALGALAVAFVGSSTAADVRVRKSWAAYTDEEKNLYVSAVEQGMKSGKHLQFTQVYMDEGSLDAVVSTCGAPAWYRKWLFGYESMLRSLDTSFANVTLPYWDIFEDSAKRLSSQTSCSGIQDCAPFLQDMGGCDGPDAAYSVQGAAMYGNCVNASVAGFACSNANSTDCEGCLPRGDWDIDGSSLEFGPTAFIEVLQRANTSDSPMQTLREGIQSSFQLSVHSVLAGAYETRAAAFDPVFLGHYATLDLVYQAFQSFNKSVALTGSCSISKGTTITSKSAIPMTRNGVAVEDDSSLSSYFTGVGSTFGDLNSQDVQYELDEFLQQLLTAFSIDSAAADTSLIVMSEDESSYEDADELEDLVEALASCSDSVVNGSSVYPPYAFMTCELLSYLQNGVFTNFSSPVREFFGSAADDLPACIDALATEAAGEVALTWSSNCVDDVSSETSIDTDDFETLTSGFAVVTIGFDGGIVYMNPST